MKEIVDFLHAAGIKGPRKNNLNINAIARILKNRKYIGEYSYRDVVVPDGIPALVEKALFERVQARMAKNRRAPAQRKAEEDYLLTTKLFCGECGAMMVGECGTSSGNGRKYHYYRCVNSKRNKTCNAKHKSVSKIPIENAVIQSVMEKIMDDAFVNFIADSVMELQGSGNPLLESLEKQLTDTERSIENLLDALQAGVGIDAVKQRLAALDEAKKSLQAQIAIEKISHPLLTRDEVVYWICRFRRLDMSVLEDRRRLVDSFVNSVTIYDGRIVITFNYKDGQKTLPISALKSSDTGSPGVSKVLEIV